MTPTDTFDGIELWNGDCLTVMRHLPAECVDSVVTDPPYGIAYQSAWRTDKRARLPRIANDDAPFVWFLWDAARVLKPGGCLVCFCRWDTAEAFRSAIEWAGLDVVSQLVWDRGVHGMGDVGRSPAPRHDLMWFATKGKYSLPGKRPTTVYQHQRLSGAELAHPNEKPKSLMSALVSDYTPPHGVVLDPFLGSGATGVGCAMTGRSFKGIEIDERHYKSATARIRAAVGEGGLFGPSPRQMTLTDTVAV